MMSLEGGNLEPTCGNPFFFALTGIGVVASAISGGDRAAYHTNSGLA